MGLVDFSKFHLNKENRDPKCHHLSIKAIKKLVICNRVPCREFVYQGISGFYDPHFCNSHFPFYDTQQQQVLLPFVFNAGTLPAVPMNSQQPQGATGTQPSLPSTSSPETSSLRSEEEDNRKKKKAKTVWKMDPWRATSARSVVGWEVWPTWKQRCEKHLGQNCRFLGHIMGIFSIAW